MNTREKKKRFMKIRDYNDEIDFNKKYQRQCEHCGRKQYLFHSQVKPICDWCGHWIFKNEKEKFKHEMESRLCKNK